MGLLTEYRNWASKYTDAPSLFQLYSGIHLFGVILGDKVWINFAGKRLFPNMWIYLISNPKIARKKTCIDLSCRIINIVDPRKIFPTNIDSWSFFITHILEKDPAGGFFGLDIYRLSQLFGDFLINISERHPINYSYKKKREIRLGECALSIISSTLLE